MSNSYPSVIVNDFIGVRGTSGSSRAARLIVDALRLTTEVSVIRPSEEPASRIRRLSQMLYWDFLQAPATALSRGSSTLIHTANTGAPAPGVKSIVVMHDTMVLDHPLHFDRGYRLYARAAFDLSVRLAHVVVTPSKHSAAQILHRWPTANVRVIPWPSTGAFGAARADSLPPGPASRTILIVGSMDRHKRLELGVNLARIFRRTHGDDVRLLMVVRNGNDNRALRATIAAADPRGDWISVLQDVSDAALAQLYRNSLFLLVPSVDEGFCLPALEATAVGVPVVHGFAGALPELIPRDSIYHVPGDALRTMLLQMDACLDAQIWVAWRDSARAATSALTFESFAARWHELVHEQ